MTVKEALPYLYDPEEVLLSFNGELVGFNPNTPIEVEVWGDYIVSKVIASDAAKFELVLAATPIKKGATA